MIVVVAAAAATVYFWYLPSRDSDDLEETMSSLMANDGGLNPAEREAADIETQSLLHKAMAAMETGYADVGSFDPAVMTPAVLASIEPTISWMAMASSDSVTAVDLPDTCHSWENEVGYFGTETTCVVGTKSQSGTTFAIDFDRAEGGGVYYLVSGVEQDWTVPSTFATATTQQAATTTTAPVGGAPSLSAHYENAELGCSFDYPGDWSDYPTGEEWNDDALLYVGDAQEPLAQLVGIPIDFIVFFGGRQPGATPPSPRTIIEQLSTGLEWAEAASITVYKPITDFKLNGIPACSISLLSQDEGPTPDMVWTYVALTYEDCAFLFYLVTSLEQLDENQPVFEAVVQSFEVD